MSVAPEIEGIANTLDVFSDNFEGIAKKIEGIENTLEDILDNFEGIAKKIEGIENTLEGISDNLEGIAKKIEGIGNTLEGILDNLEGISNTWEGIAPKNGGMGATFEGSAWQHHFDYLTTARATVARSIEHSNTQRPPLRPPIQHPTPKPTSSYATHPIHKPPEQHWHLSNFEGSTTASWSRNERGKRFFRLMPPNTHHFNSATK